MSPTLLTLFATIIAYAVSANSVAPLISTLAGRLNVPAAFFGIFIVVQAISFAAASFLGGFVKARLRLNNYHLMAGGLGLITLALLVAPAVLRSAAAIAVWIVPLGLAGASVETFASVEISVLSPPASSKNLNISQAFYSAGAFAATQIVFLGLGAGLDWQGIFIVFGTFTLAIGLLFVLRSRARFRRPGQEEDGETLAASDPAPTASVGSARVFSSLLSLMIAYVILESIAASWLAYIFEVTYRLTARDAALALAAFWAGVTLGRFAIVLLPDRWTLWPALLACSAALLVLAGLLAGWGSLHARFALVFLLGLAAGPIWPTIVMTTAVSCRSEHRTAAVVGVGALGFALGPLLGSLLVRLRLTSYYFLVLAGTAAAILAICLASYTMYRRAAARGA